MAPKRKSTKASSEELPPKREKKNAKQEDESEAAPAARKGKTAKAAPADPEPAVKSSSKPAPSKNSKLAKSLLPAPAPAPASAPAPVQASEVKSRPPRANTNTSQKKSPKSLAAVEPVQTEKSTGVVTGSIMSEIDILAIWSGGVWAALFVCLAVVAAVFAVSFGFDIYSGYQTTADAPRIVTTLGWYSAWVTAAILLPFVVTTLFAVSLNIITHGEPGMQGAFGAVVVGVAGMISLNWREVAKILKL